MAEPGSGAATARHRVASPAAPEAEGSPSAEVERAAPGRRSPLAPEPNNFRRTLANLDIASGKVTAVAGSTLTVSGITVSGGSFGRLGRSSSTSKTKKPTKPKTQKLTVTTSGSTTVNATESAAATALAVGDCVSAFGPAATNGSVTATTVRITSTGGGSCTGGFGGRGGFFGGAGGGGA